MKIVVGVDGSPSSQRALEWCARYAKALAAEVVAVHAVEIPVYASSGTMYVPVVPLSDGDREGLRDVVDREWCAPLHDAGVDLRVIVSDGTAATVVLKTAEDEDADLVVTGRRGLSGFKELLLGSTSHQLSHHLARPVLIVP
jgi:nucleotide-binding universal stress UspA family protein